MRHCHCVIRIDNEEPPKRVFEITKTSTVGPSWSVTSRFNEHIYNVMGEKIDHQITGILVISEQAERYAFKLVKEGLVRKLLHHQEIKLFVPCCDDCKHKLTCLIDHEAKVTLEPLDEGEQ